jgi:hypothetical protein
MAHAFSRRAEEGETIRIAAGLGLFFALFGWTVPGGGFPRLPHGG